MGLAGLAGGLGLRGLARAETPTPEHSRHATPTPDVTAATNHAGDHGGMGTVGQVDHAANQFDPHEILTDFDTGVLTEEDGRPVRTWEMYAVDREFEIAPGVHFPGWVYGTPTSAASRRLGHVVANAPGRRCAASKGSGCASTSSTPAATRTPSTSTASTRRSWTVSPASGRG